MLENISAGTFTAGGAILAFHFPTTVLIEPEDITAERSLITLVWTDLWISELENLP
jgi:hypothetical protein